LEVILSTLSGGIGLIAVDNVCSMMTCFILDIQRVLLLYHIIKLSTNHVPISLEDTRLPTHFLGL